MYRVSPIENRCSLACCHNACTFVWFHENMHCLCVCVYVRVTLVIFYVYFSNVQVKYFGPWSLICYNTNGNIITYITEEAISSLHEKYCVLICRWCICTCAVARVTLDIDIIIRSRTNLLCRDHNFTAMHVQISPIP